MEETLKGIRSFEAGEKDEAKLAETLANIKIIMDDLDKAESQIKSTIKETYTGEVYYFPTVQKKVFLSEGKSTSYINPAGVLLNMQNSGIGNMFPDIVNVVKSKVETLPEEFQSQVENIIKLNTKSDKGSSYITVAKMNKTELKEHKA
jgi:ribosomal protein L19